MNLFDIILISSNIIMAVICLAIICICCYQRNRRNKIKYIPTSNDEELDDMEQCDDEESRILYK